MKLSRTTTILLIALAVVTVIGGAVIYNATKEETSDATVTEAAQAASEAEVVFINLASQIGSISFDTQFLADPRFLSLIDIRVAVIPEDAERADPFAPIAGVPLAPR